MNSMHDLGGMHGFGPIPIEEDEPVFHTEWEAKALALRMAMAGWGKWNLDAARHANESLSPVQYLNLSYFEIWITSLADLVVNAGMVSMEEIASGAPARDSEKLTPPPTDKLLTTLLQTGRPASRALEAPPRFAVGDRIRTNSDSPKGHTRLPRYARGREGEIVIHHGGFVFPDSNSQFEGENPQHLYAARFTARELWGAQGGERDSVVLDVWESYLKDG